MLLDVPNNTYRTLEARGRSPSPFVKKIVCRYFNINRYQILRSKSRGLTWSATMLVCQDHCLDHSTAWHPNKHHVDICRPDLQE
jgi:hypothetical protein